MNKEQLSKIIGGNNVSGTMINALIKAVTTFFEMGQMFGSGLRRIMLNKTCKPM